MSEQNGGLLSYSEFQPVVVPPKDYSLRTAERNHIVYVLVEYDGNKKEAARALGVARGTLYRKIKEYGIEV